MIDTATTRPILILGGTSAIAVAYERLRAAEGCAFVLMGRRQDRLEAVASDLIVRGAIKAQVLTADLAQPEKVTDLWKMVLDQFGAPAEVVIAYGVLGDMDQLRADPEALRYSLDTNFVSAALWLEQAAMAMEGAGSGRIVAIGSVAGDRGRQSNYLYGAAKAALERQMQGLAHRFALGGGQVTAHLVKPGFVDTPMTDGLPRGGLLWASADAVARAMHKGISAGRRTIYAPWFWRYIMLIIRFLPDFVLHRTRL